MRSLVLVFFPLRLPKGNLYFSIFVCVTVCVFYIRAAAAARDRAAAAVVGAWPNIWLRHHQTRYFFFSISLFENQREGEREKLVWWPAIPSTDIWYNDGRHWDSNHVEEVRLFSLPSPTLFFSITIFTNEIFLTTDLTLFFKPLFSLSASLSFKKCDEGWVWNAHSQELFKHFWSSREDIIQYRDYPNDLRSICSKM